LRVISSESAYFKVFDRASRVRPVRANAASHRGMMSEDRSSVFARVPTDSPAAIRQLGATGKVPV
jgi:hypothetical protein